MKSEQTVIWPGYSVWIKDTILCETAIMQALFYASGLRTEQKAVKQL